MFTAVTAVEWGILIIAIVLLFSTAITATSNRAFIACHKRRILRIVPTLNDLDNNDLDNAERNMNKARLALLDPTDPKETIKS